MSWNDELAESVDRTIRRTLYLTVAAIAGASVVVYDVLRRRHRA